MGEYGILWAKTEKRDDKGEPSMKEVVMGIFLYHMLIVEIEFKELEEKYPEKIQLYRK